MKKLGPLGVVAIIIVLIIVSIGGTNPYTPAGHQGYVETKPLFLGRGGFAGVITGPRKYGLSWRKFATNVDIRPQTYTEEFKILTKDDLNITFRFHAVMAIKDNSLKFLIEKFGGRYWYKRYVQESFRTYVRDAVQRFTATEVKVNRSKITENVKKNLENYLKDTPVKMISLVVGNIDYPEVVTKAVEKKLAAQQLLQEKETQRQIAEKDAEIRITEAKGIAKSQEIINSTLTANYLQHEAIQAQLKMASSPNHTTVYIPSGPNGIPLVYDPSRKKSG